MQLATPRSPIDFTPFDLRLNAPDGGPVAVAVSGGGDSLGLMLAAKAWADRAGRPLLALTVDHALQAAGADWARFVGDRARRLGIAHRTLVWRGDKPVSGVPAAARAARHALLADAARAAGARVILMGHTADDADEAAAMRAAGARVPTPRAWSPSPAWPEGRGVFLLRPLLPVRRAALRAWLAALGETWIEDPANDDPGFLRARIRRRLAAGVEPGQAPAEGPSAACVALDLVKTGPAGDLEVPRAMLSPPGARRLVAALCVCAGGGSRVPRGAALDRLLARLRSNETFTAVLAGARVAAQPEWVRFCREPGELRRRDLGHAPLQPGENVFDGRFVLAIDAPGWSVRPLRGLAARLPAAERRRLADLPAEARGALPLAIRPDQAPTCPVLAQDGPIRVSCLTRTRLFAALGAIPDEASIWRVAKSQPNA